MSYPPHKKCPVCGQPAKLTLDVCRRCGHAYRTKFPEPKPAAQPPPAYAHCRHCGQQFERTSVVGSAQQAALCPTCTAKQVEQHKLDEFFRSYREQIVNAPDLPSQAEIRRFAQLANQLGIEPARAFQYRWTRQESLTLIHRALSVCKTDGEITAREEHYLRMLQRELYIAAEDFAPISDSIRRYKRIHEIRSGRLPVVRTNTILPADEICRWDAIATYRKVSQRSMKPVSGQLVLTDQRVRFVSDESGFKFPLGDIAAFSVQQGAVGLRLTRSQGNGRYEMQDADVFCEMLRAVLAAYHRYVAFNHAGSRSIPQEVKNAVWTRDGGKCVQCGARDQLEFDHVIPWSKGGASSEANLQLLCRRCNLAKSARI